ncbi:hypothetical protein KUTeg_003123 [Tegillarca granosa]|uniref:Uncharacterized protein n=1 Tax=Tegillarca granosa TaxID=220873 RepID=A0ABQ9FN18_TEGGR|nr:hypothetical protein KUTeg_003123 [Tegillarca granosa]
MFQKSCNNAEINEFVNFFHYDRLFNIVKMTTIQIILKYIKSCMHCTFLGLLITTLVSAVLVDGQWGAWTDWSRCSGQCGSDGNMKRTRLCNNPIPNKNGFPCAGFGMQSKICREPCKSKHKASTKEAKAYLDKINLAYPELLISIGPVCNVLSIMEHAQVIDGGWSPWSDWSPCHPDCGLGTTFRFKTCTNPIPANSGLPCIGESVEEKSCFGVGCSKEGKQDICNSYIAFRCMDRPEIYIRWICST